MNYKNYGFLILLVFLLACTKESSFPKNPKNPYFQKFETLEGFGLSGDIEELRVYKSDSTIYDRYIFDNYGNVLEKTSMNKGDRKFRYRCEMDSNKVVRRSSPSNNYLTAEYDEKDRLKILTRYHREGRKSSILKYGYTSEGYFKYESEYFINDYGGERHHSVKRYGYDELGRVILSEDMRKEEDYPSFYNAIKKYSYPSKNIVIDSIYKREGSPLVEFYKNKYQGAKVVKSTRYNTESKPGTPDIYEYNIYGDLVKRYSETGRDTLRNEYDYDTQKNWVSKNQYNNGKLVFSEKRIIKYRKYKYLF